MERIDPNQKYTVYEASRILGVCARTVYNYIAEGALDSMVFESGSIRIYGTSLLAFERSAILRSRKKNNYRPSEFDIQPSLF